MQPNKHDQIDLDYLHKESIIGVIAEGLHHIYRSAPKKPIDTLARWLLQHSKTEHNHKLFKKQLQLQDEMKLKYLEDLEVQKGILQQEVELQNQQRKYITDFEDKIRNHLYHAELMEDEFADFLMNYKNLSGVYICHLDMQKQEVDLENDDSDASHINGKLPKLLHYVAASENHRYLIGTKIQPDQGITYDVLKPVVHEDGTEGSLKPLYIPDVIKDPRIFYHKWPKLGAYFAIPLVFHRTLYEDSFDSGLENRLAYLAKKQEQDKMFEEKKTEFEQNMRLREENGEDTSDLVEEFEALKESLAEIQEKPFISFKDEYIVCMDTLGQDRGISPSDRRLLENFVQYFGQCWQEAEQIELSESIDHQINYLNSLHAPLEQILQEQQAEEDQYVEERIAENPEFYAELQQNDERAHTYELDCFRLERLRERLLDENYHKPLLDLANRRIIKFPGILQSGLYLIGYDKASINEAGTNVLNWRKLRTLIDSKLIQQILDYNHRGQKTRKPKPYGMISRIQKQLSNFDQETVDAYCLPYGSLLKYLNTVCRLRREDVEIRRLNLENLRNRIAQVQEEIDNMKVSKPHYLFQTLREQNLEAHKQGLSEEELETFDENEWLSQYDQQNVIPDIPEDKPDDVDEDYD